MTHNTTPPKWQSVKHVKTVYLNKFDPNANDSVCQKGNVRKKAADLRIMWIISIIFETERQTNVDSCVSPIRRFDNSNNRNLFVVDLVLSGVHVRASNYDGFHCQPFVQLLLGRGKKRANSFRFFYPSRIP